MLRYKRGQTLILRDQLKQADLRLRFIAYSMAAFCAEEFGKDLIVTEIVRTRAMQRSYYPDQPNKRSVHEFGRGIDFGVRAYGAQELDPHPISGQGEPHPGFRDTEINRLDAWYSAVVRYDDERPEYDSIVHHNIGLGDHIHVQVSWRPSTRLTSDRGRLRLMAERLGVSI